jgi:hypothetical protein
MVAQWLRYCATNQRVADSFPDVIGIFHWHNPSDRTMVLGSTQPLTEMSNRSISWGYKRPVRKADNLTTILCRCHVIWEPELSGKLWAALGLQRDCFTFTFTAELCVPVGGTYVLESEGPGFKSWYGDHIVFLMSFYQAPRCYLKLYNTRCFTRTLRHIINQLCRSLNQCNMLCWNVIKWKKIYV